MKAEPSHHGPPPDGDTPPALHEDKVRSHLLPNRKRALLIRYKIALDLDIQFSRNKAPVIYNFPRLWNFVLATQIDYGRFSLNNSPDSRYCRSYRRIARRSKGGKATYYLWCFCVLVSSPVS